MNSREIGNLGERLSCEYLVDKGYDILCKNWRINFGEIDIIARKKSSLFARIFGKSDKTIHFVEVKALEAHVNQAVFPEEHVNFKKKQKLQRLAQIWLKSNGFQDYSPYQIDVVGILIDTNTRNAKLHYFPNAIENI